ncbi:M6 family metalloprotease domain protein [Oceanobacillus picturae]|uniref:M6 family metalloprotease domain protein n=1 Tax=Oceanobacillus picturae TaxID=171693 RepID=W9BEU8_9BACI|nr:M6 family metalloprotease domain-containing protein [Oceanobacillus picturae]RIU93379.1 M6 family metalloprotease domain-containing protein [Oceanobacillus picturae]GAQ17910.1 M6 family metalloprotease domain protein [Oceanobacillus picturae]CDO04810.1 M6 family metalloprotease domain protein [Oceanobacillus picturae]
MKVAKSLVLAVLIMMLLSTTAQAASEGLPAFPSPIDSQNWTLPEDMTWEDYEPVPGVDWRNSEVEPERVLKGALIVVDFQDRDFIISQEEGSMEAGNPVGNGNIPREDVGEYWVDFLNKPQTLNNYRTINEYWRENSYGKWAVELEAFGPYRMDGNEFQYGLNEFGQQENMPPGYEAKSLRPEAMSKAEADMEAFGEEFDFTFILHAGYDESGVWQEFGEMMFLNEEAVTDEFGPPLDYDMPNWALTRYVDWTSWVAGKSIWSSADIRNGISVQGENDGMGTFAHEFGHIMNLLDNYNNPYANPVSRTYSGPWELMSRGSFNGPGGPHTRWMVMPTLGGSAPSHHMLRNKIKQGFLSEEDYLNVDRDALAETGPVFADILARAVPEDSTSDESAIHGINIMMEDLTPANSLEDDWRADMQRGEKWYDNYTVEVVDRVGMDSFTPDSGVLLAKTKDSESAPNIWVIDSHEEDINQKDFTRPDGTDAMYSKGDYRQLSDALFKAGTGNDVVSEYVDEYNRLHFYILNHNRDTEDPLSYRVAVRHLDGGGDFARGVKTESGEQEQAIPGKVAKHYFQVTNTGEATDLFRLRADIDGGWETMLEQEVIEVESGETVKVPVYVEVPENKKEAVALSFTATSETDASQVEQDVTLLLSNLSATGLKELLNRYEVLEDISNEETLRALQTHLTVVERFEKKKESEKVIKHMEGFMQLVTHQRDQGNITEISAGALLDYSDYVIEEWK